METLSGRHLVVFGCGYVGTAVAQWAMANGLRVTALTRNATSAVLLREIGIRTVVADLAGEAWHEAISDAADYAVNCVSSGGGGIEAYRHSYRHGMESVVAWARKHRGVGTFLYTSSTSVYPQGDGVWVDETMPTSAASDRAQVLIETEAAVTSEPRPWERCFILRLAGIYGPGRHALLEQVQRGEVSGTGNHHLNLIHRDDIVTAVAACLSAPKRIANEVFNVADDGRATKSEIVRWLAERLGVPAPVFTGAPAEGRRQVTPDRVIANEKLKSMLGWRPRHSTFREGYASLLSR
jgi:nucleoside-diphosphate-sugar epimerase